jgi:hypothetical protein
MSQYDAAEVQLRPPTEGGEDVTAPTVAYMEARQYHQLALDMEQRIQFGEKKYGVRLRTRNGRDPLLDCYQELLDGAVYAKQAEMEGRDSDETFKLIVGLAERVRLLMNSAARVRLLLNPQETKVGKTG